MPLIVEKSWSVVYVLYNSYNPWSYYEADPELKKAVDQIKSGYFNTSSPSLFVEIADHLLHHDK